MRITELPNANTELDIETVHAEVGRHILAHKANYGRDHRFADWHANCLVNNIVLAKRGYDIDVNGQCNALLGRLKQPGGCKVKQKMILKRLQAKKCVRQAVVFQHKMRTRLDRWQAGIPKAHVHGRATRRLLSLKGKIKPAHFVIYSNECNCI